MCCVLPYCILNYFFDVLLQLRQPPRGNSMFRSLQDEFASTGKSVLLSPEISRIYKYVNWKIKTPTFMYCNCNDTNRQTYTLQFAFYYAACYISYNIWMEIICRYMIMWWVCLLFGIGYYTHNKNQKLKKKLKSKINAIKKLFGMEI